jgi:hypothetical protein
LLGGDETGDEPGGVKVSAGDAVSVDVERGGGSGVSESLGDSDDGDAVAEHLACHEVPQIVQSKAAHAGTTEVTDELSFVTRFGSHGDEPSRSAENATRRR